MDVLLCQIAVLLCNDHRPQRCAIEGVEIGKAKGGGHERSMA